ncbi:MAG: caspase family protein [Bryobacteraceae bacterium]|nr:caspase family protein [Bryobacteraceae bacterium]
MRTVLSLALLTAFLAPLGVAQDQGRRVALIIGNGSYLRRPLRNAINDAKLMDKALQGVGFKTIVRENANRAQMEEAVVAFLNAIGPGDTALFFYAGHAVQVENENLLIPTDLDRAQSVIDAKLKSFSMAFLFEHLNRSRAAERIIILDACRSNPVVEDRGLTAGLAMPLNAGRDSYIVFSTSPNSTASDNPDGANSYFTEALAELLRKPGLSIDEVMTQVNRRVAMATEGRQTPWKQGSLTRTFHFIPPVGGVEAADPSLLEERLTEAIRLRQRGNWEEALAATNLVLKGNPVGEVLDTARALQQYLALRVRAEEAAEAGDWLTAASVLRELFERDRLDSEAALLAGTYYLLARRIPEAIVPLASARSFGTSKVHANAVAILERLAPITPAAKTALGATSSPTPHEVSKLPLWYTRGTLPSVAIASLERVVGARQRVTPPVEIAFASFFSGESEVRLRERGREEVVVTAAAPASTAAAAAGEAPTAGLDIVPIGESRDLVFQEEPADPPTNVAGPARSGTVPVKVTSTPMRAKLSAEGDPPQSCETPCIVHLPPGRNVLKASRNGYRDAARIVEVKRGGSEVRIELQMKTGNIRVDAEKGVPILMEGRPTKYSTPAVMALPEGKYEFRWAKQGVVTFKEEVYVKDGELSKVTIPER